VVHSDIKLSHLKFDRRTQSLRVIDWDAAQLVSCLDLRVGTWARVAPEVSESGKKS